MTSAMKFVFRQEPRYALLCFPFLLYQRSKLLCVKLANGFRNSDNMSALTRIEVAL